MSGRRTLLRQAGVGLVEVMIALLLSLLTVGVIIQVLLGNHKTYLTGEAIVAFVVLKGPVPTGDDAKALAKELRDWVGKEIGPIAKPKEIRFGENLPKTRSGKIMRRLLRGIAKGETITQDTSTLENPAILDQLSKTN